MSKIPSKTTPSVAQSGPPGHDGAERSPSGETNKATPAPPKRKRGAPAGISRNHIIAAAMTVASRDGRKFQFKDVADELGVTRGALHSYFRGMEVLRREMASEILLAMSPRRKSGDTGVAHLKKHVRECAEYTKNHPHLSELAGMELASDPWIYPRLILTLSEALDELDVAADQHLAALSLELDVIVGLTTGVDTRLWRLTPSEWPTSVLSLVKVLPPTSFPTLRALMASKGKGAAMVGSNDFAHKTLGDSLGGALVAGLKTFAKPNGFDR